MSREGDVNTDPNDGIEPESSQTSPTSEASGSRRLMFLLAAAMFVLVVDTSLMNVSISAVIEDLDTTASGVQSAIALEALVSAAFILINSKVGDLIGRKRAYVLGLLAYAVGALAMTLAQGLTAIVIFWAIIGGLGASLLLPAMQSLIHGNFAGAAQKQAYALVGAAAAIAAAIGPLLGGFVTTYLSWRVGFGLGGRHHRGRPEPDRVWCATSPTPAPARSTWSARSCRSSAWVASCSGSWSGRRVASTSAAHGGSGPWHWWLLARWLIRRKRAGQVTLLDPDAVRASELHRRGLGPDAAADHPRRRHDRPPALLPDDARVRRPGGRTFPGPAVADHVRGRAGGRQEGGWPASRRHHPHRLHPDQRRDRRSSSRSSREWTAVGTS